MIIELRTRVPMVDFSFFRPGSSSARTIVGFVVSFAMLAMFFFIVLYMQNVLRYSRLEAGVRFLPSTLVLIVLAPITGLLTDRLGARPLIVFGLLCIAGSLFWQSRLTAGSGYGFLSPDSS